MTCRVQPYRPRIAEGALGSRPEVGFWHLAADLIDGQSVSALPPDSDVDLLRNCESVVYLDPQVSDRALYLCVPKQKLHRTEIAGAAVDDDCLGAT